ncbi:MAG: glycosyltransferase [Pyrinomonadaceae bacterium]|nr:glycosyltransferase [Pyrinomonadaceae bacterium]
MIKKMLKDNLPFSVKRYFGKLSASVLRMFFRTSRTAFQFSAEVLNYSRRHGFNLERELPPPIANLMKVAESSAFLNPFGVSDFLLLTARRETNAAPETIETSIIIPVFNKAEFTFECLRSLFREIDLTENEIIVVDNASTDETARMLAQFGNRVRVIRNAGNLGFVEACNLGAGAARGKFLVFLNNDTIVQPAWLSSLVETIEADETVGAVGSMLIFPDGRLQEAGGIVWNDGTAHLYGYGESPEDRQFNFRREVDYCSGASLFISKDLFDSFGGFDMRYAPAYYEDTDLCMSVRAANLKVVFQPLSKVIHFEGATAGRSTNTGYKRFQEINSRKFFDKWREVLEREHFAPGNVEAASNRSRKPKILVAFTEIPKPDHDSGNVRMVAILKTLAKDYRVVLTFIYKRPDDAEYERQLGNIGVETVWVVDLDRRFKREKFDFGLLCYPHVAYYFYPTFKRMFPAAKIIFDTVDVHFVRLMREFELTGDRRFAKDAKRHKKIETNLANAADQVWCVTEDDKKNLQAAAPNAKIEIVPNIHRLYQRGEPFAARKDLLFIGNFGHRPNADAVYYFLKEIFPRVLKKLPDLRFRIVGSHAPPEIFALDSENVRVEGFVPNIEPLFETCRVFVAPLRYGAGMKGKIGQALSFGLPTVTTSVGAEGMNLTNEREVLIADAPEAFAAEICRVYEDEKLWQTLSDEGFNFIKNNFSPKIVEEQIQNALQKVSASELPAPAVEYAASNREKI